MALKILPLVGECMYEKNINAFSLIELLVVMTISSILMTIGITSYTKNLRLSRRQEAIQALLEVKIELEQQLVIGATSVTLNDLNSKLKTIRKSGNTWYSQNEFYIITIDSYSPPNYTISATANSAKDQIKDTACFPISVNQTQTTPFLPAGCS